MNFVFAPSAIISVPVIGQPEQFPVHRIYCVGRNYEEHAKEMGYTGREPPFFFLKPADALVVVDEKGEYKTIEASQRLLNLGYCVTSYASQGKTVDTVILADAGSAMATHQKEWYVSISRARKNITIFSEDLAGLGERIITDKTRSLGVDLKAKGRQRAPRRAGNETLSSAMTAGLKRAVAQMVHVQVFTRRLARTSRLRTNQFIKNLWKSHNRI